MAPGPVASRRPARSVSVLLEGFTPEELLALSEAELDAYLFHGEPVVFRAGSAEVLGEFRRTPERLTVELAQIDGGGEGVLPTLFFFARRYAGQRGLREVEWIVHAVHCARPNPKLRRVLERRGFTVREVAGMGEAYWLLEKRDHDAD